MRYFYFISTIFTAIQWNMNLAQDFTGKYLIQTENGEFSLTLTNNGNESYTGNFTGNGNTFLLQGKVQNGILYGTIGDQQNALIFESQLNNNALTITIVETDAFNQPVLSTAQTLIFYRQLTQDKITNSNKDVIINNDTLSKAQIEELEAMYGIKPLPGNYWYDTKSGLYGVIGYPAYGFMYPGHNFGSLKRDASKGNTNIILNGRELSQAEWAIWSYILGYWIQPGSYWLDSKGNAGYEGNPLPMVNLFMAAQQNMYQGKGGSGDNFWSSRFSAGNYDSGNQRGYVSVPGHGPIGYGF